MATSPSPIQPRAFLVPTDFSAPIFFFLPLRLLRYTMPTVHVHESTGFLTEARGWQRVEQLCLDDKIRCLQFPKAGDKDNAKACAGPMEHVWSRVTGVRSATTSCMLWFFAQHVNLIHGSKVLLHRGEASSPSPSAFSAPTAAAATPRQFVDHLENEVTEEGDETEEAELAPLHFVLGYDQDLAHSAVGPVFVWNDKLEPHFINTPDIAQHLHTGEHKVWSGVELSWDHVLGGASGCTNRNKASFTTQSMPLTRCLDDKTCNHSLDSELPVYALLGCELRV
jgi:hypothetical protein